MSNRWSNSRSTHYMSSDGRDSIYRNMDSYERKGRSFESTSFTTSQFTFTNNTTSHANRPSTRRRTRRRSSPLDSRHRSRRRNRTPTPSHSEDSDQSECGRVSFREGDLIRDGRYRVVKYLDKGTFGTVLSCVDYKHNERVAIKIVRSIKRYLRAAYVEVDILDRLRRANSSRIPIVKFLGSFTTKIHDQEHVCITFEQLGCSLYHFIKKNSYRGFLMHQIRSIARQLLEALEFLHDNRLAHTDLKLENILFVRDDYEMIDDRVMGRNYRKCVYTEIRLIDFGSATYDEDTDRARIVNTRQYRAPEVILGLGWNHRSDLWCLGCILAELYSGSLLFQTHENFEHLALMEKILTKSLPRDMVKVAIESNSLRRSASPGRSMDESSTESEMCRRLFDREFRLLWPEIASSQRSVDRVRDAERLSLTVRCPDLEDLIRDLLRYHPENRVTAKDALRHKFFKETW